MKWVLGKVRQPREVANALEWRIRTLAKTYSKPVQLKRVRESLIILGEYERQLVAEGVVEEDVPDSEDEDVEEEIGEETEEEKKEREMRASWRASDRKDDGLEEVSK
jgi:hypothetical protein